MKTTCPIRKVIFYSLGSSFWCSNRPVENYCMQKYVNNTKGCYEKKNSFLERQECIHNIRICRAWCRKTVVKQTMQQGSWAVLGMEIECILLRLLLTVPSIAFDQQYKPFPFQFFDALAMKICHGVKKKQIKNRQC